MAKDNAELTKEEQIEQVHSYIENQGISLEDLAVFQMSRKPATEEDASNIIPTQIAGVANDPCKSNETLTAEVAALKGAINDFLATHFSHYPKV